MRSTPNEIDGVGFLPPFVSLFFRTISQKPMQLGSSNLTQKCFTMSPGNPFVFGSNGYKVTSHKNIAGMGVCTLVSAGSSSYWFTMIINAV